MRFSRRTLFLGAAAGGLAGAQPGPSGAVGRRFQAEALREIAFPLGGIGTGTVSLGGYGDLRDWEIFNRPNKGSILPYTFAALRIAGGGLKEPAAKVLEREVLPPFPESHGIGRERAAGLPRFREAVFVGGYPVASIFFQDPKWPVDVSLEAFNPMVPLETEQSSLPVAILIYSTRSRAAAPLDASLAFSIMNPVGYDGTKLASRRAACFGRNINEFRSESGANGLFLHSDCIPPESFRYGSLALATDAAEVSYRPRWEHGALWDELPAWWRDFCARGRFAGGEPKPSDTGFTEYASLAAHFALAPGETRRTAFVLSWHFPNIEDYWTGLKPYYGHQEVRRLIRNEYGTRWKSAWEPAIHTIRNLSSLRERTLRYRDTLYASTLPPEVIDAVSSQASIIRTNTLLVEEGGRALAFEGCGDDQGCCPMNCTHVFNYEQSLAHLYPDLERSMRDTDFLQNLREDGYMSFRTATPVQHGAYTKHPAADGQMGTILKLYREWMLSGDDAWLRRLWPHA
ncbi:MAG: non-lysosomal glucosylceramidase, partial [Acidobacteria bacterium]|nr:non-lysosomal glucosylceramidase [Acidobacteriota bacterium]